MSPRWPRFFHQPGHGSRSVVVEESLSHDGCEVHKASMEFTVGLQSQESMLGTSHTPGALARAAVLAPV